MKYKRLIISLSVILCVILVCITLSFTLFTVHKTSIHFKNQTTKFVAEDVINNVIKSAEIPKNTPVFALNKNAIIERLEIKNPYLKVINVEISFPNSIVLHCAEREEMFYIKSSDDMYYICDDELKLLMDKQQTVILKQSNPILIEGIVVSNLSASIGQTIELVEGKDVIKNISKAFAYSNKSLSDIKAMFKSIKMTYERNFYTYENSPVLTFTTFDNFQIKINASNNKLIEKVNMMLSLIPTLYEKYEDYKLVIDINPETNEFYTVLEELQFNN